MQIYACYVLSLVAISPLPISLHAVIVAYGSSTHSDTIGIASSSRVSICAVLMRHFFPLHL